MVVETAIAWTTQALRYLGVALGASMVVYPTAVTLSGGVNYGEEDEIIAQLFIGFLILAIIFLP